MNNLKKTDKGNLKENRLNINLYYLKTIIDFGILIALLYFTSSYKFLFNLKGIFFGSAFILLTGIAGNYSARFLQTERKKHILEITWGILFLVFLVSFIFTLSQNYTLILLSLILMLVFNGFSSFLYTSQVKWVFNGFAPDEPEITQYGLDQFFNYLFSIFAFNFIIILVLYII